MYRYSSKLMLAVVLCLCVGQRARGAEENRLRQHCELAEVLYRQGRYEESLRELEAAYAIKALPRLLLNIGQLFRKLGQEQQAIQAYAAYLSKAHEPVPEVEQEILHYMKDPNRQAGAGMPSSASPTPRAPPLALVPNAQPPPFVKPQPGRPIYKRWWLWTAVGVAVAGGVAGIAVAATRSAEAPPVGGGPGSIFPVGK